MCTQAHTLPSCSSIFHQSDLYACVCAVFINTVFTFTLDFIVISPFLFMYGWVTKEARFHKISNTHFTTTSNTRSGSTESHFWSFLRGAPAFYIQQMQLYLCASVPFSWQWFRSKGAIWQHMVFIPVNWTMDDSFHIPIGCFAYINKEM